MIAEIHFEIGSTEVTGDYMQMCTQNEKSIHVRTSNTSTILNALGVINQFDRNIQDQSGDISLHINQHIQFLWFKPMTKLTKLSDVSNSAI